MANRSDRDSKSMRRGDRRILSMAIARNYIKPGQDAADVRKLMIEAGQHARSIKTKRMTLKANVDSATEVEEG